MTPHRFASPVLAVLAVFDGAGDPAMAPRPSARLAELDHAANRGLILDRRPMLDA